MQLTRTARGLQWQTVEPASQEESAPPEGPVRRALTTSKEFLPWLMLLMHMCSWFGMKYLTSDRLQQQQGEDHIAIEEMRKEVRTVATEQAAISAKFDLYIALKGK